MLAACVMVSGCSLPPSAPKARAKRKFICMTMTAGPVISDTQRGSCDVTSTLDVRTLTVQSITKFAFPAS